MSKRYLHLSALLLLFLIFVGKAFYASAAENDKKVTKGVFIDEVDVSGMTEAEAKAAVDSFVDSLRKKKITIMSGENSVNTTLGELGYNYEPNDNIEQALSIGTTGNLIKRYKDLKDIEQGNKVLPLTFTLNEKTLDDLIEKQVGKYNIKPVNATVSRKSGELVYTDHIMGKKVNVLETANAVKNTVLNNWNRTDTVIEAVMDDDDPVYTRDVVEKCNTLLGTFTTEYASSAEGRAANLANGARLINNTILYPGEVFSGHDHLTPFSEENGYYEAGAYLQGKVIDSIGGGACQVTTTLYNAVLNAELEVVERQPHSMTISYVDLSRDAAIAGDYKDLKFKNNTDVPILIEAYTRGRKITFNIWGYETRNTNNRRIEYVTVVLGETPPPADVIEKDPTQPITYKKVTQAAHTGYKAELYKVVYENDKEVSRTLVNKSSYSAAPRYITVGTKKVEIKPDKQEQEKKPDEEINPDNNMTEEEAQLESQTTSQENITNPDGQIQGEIYWDPELENQVED